MKAISTKYLGPTNHRGGRVVASAEGVSSVTIPYDHSLDAYGVHEKAALALCRKYGWSGRLVGGGTRTGYCFVFADSAGRDRRRPHYSASRRRSRVRSRRRR